jgi:lysophospholipid acyltransferase (LPLAT)-like uncharacterized protein
MTPESQPSSATGSTTPLQSGMPVMSVTPLPRGRAVVAFLITLVMRFITGSLRYRWHFQPEVLVPDSGPFIFAIWHNRCSLAPAIYKYVVKQRGDQRTLAAIVSLSRDGSVMARVMEHFGVQPVRGSSSRRGGLALLELATWSARGYDVAITPDGPRGPRYVVQTGAIKLAQITGRPIVPVSYRLNWKIRVNSWDRHMIALPFARMDFRSAELLSVPPEATEAHIEELRQELERRLLSITED